MAKNYIDAGTVVSDIWYKGQRALRTLVQVGIPAFLGFAVVLPQIISALGLPADGPLYAWLIGAAGVVTAVAVGLSRVMAIPAVNAWLTTVGLGSVPKSQAVTGEHVATADTPRNGDALVANDGLATPPSGE